MRAFALLSLPGVAFAVRPRYGANALSTSVTLNVETNWGNGDEKDVCSGWGESFWHQSDGSEAAGKTFVSLYAQTGPVIPRNIISVMSGLGEERFDEAWHVLTFEPTESHTYLEFTSSSFRGEVLFATPERDYYGTHTEVIGPLRAKDYTSNSITNSKDPTVTDFWGWYHTKAKCKNGATDNCEINFKSVADVKCRNCPVGYSASPCSPAVSLSTACTGCTTATTPPGQFCTGAMPVYSVKYNTKPHIVNGGLYLSSDGTTYTSEPRREPLEPCPVGFFCSGGQLTRCGLGKFCREESSVEVDCPEGRFCVTPERWDFCPVGSKCPAGSTQPQDCERGTYAGMGSSRCRPCAAGTYAASGNAEKCDYCPPGTWQPNEGSVACVMIPAGHYSGDRKTITACPAGSFCPAGSGKPTACKEGTFSYDLADACSECPAGSSQPFSGKVMCEPCAVGSNQSATGQKSCETCRAGLVTGNSTGLAECVACASNGTARVDTVSSVCVCKSGFNGTTCSARISGGSAGATSSPTARTSAPFVPAGPSSSTGSDSGIVLPAALGGLAGAALLVVAGVAWRRRQHSASKHPLDAWAEGRPHTAI